MKKLVKFFSLFNLYLGVILIITPILISVMVLINDKLFSTVGAESNSSLQKESNTSLIESQILLSGFDVFESQSEKISDFKIDNEIRNYGNKLTIPSIGVDTYIWESVDGKASLDNGVWRHNLLGIPGSDDPVVLSAHRWGRLGLDRDFRNKNMFFNFPSLSNGDSIVINWQGNTYTYNIIEKYESSFVSKVSDLVLITCRDLDAKVKIIVLAELKEIKFKS